jgi:hypothetical protein
MGGNFHQTHALFLLCQKLSEVLQLLHSPIVTCHNDLLCKNIILDTVEGTKTINFIDYEYAGANYRGYDIGNHFCEFAGETPPRSLTLLSLFTMLLFVCLCSLSPYGTCRA